MPNAIQTHDDIEDDLGDEDGAGVGGDLGDDDGDDQWSFSPNGIAEGKGLSLSKW